MDVLCLRCGEPWHTDYVRHEAPEEFERNGCVIARCPCCPDMSWVPPAERERLAALVKVAEMHGNDLEAFAAYLEDIDDGI
jgi:hypothetical protein